MGLVLGLDGKRRAMDINKTDAVPQITTLYVGLLQAAPANMDGMDLAMLIHPDHGNEFTIDPDFYTGRQAIQLSLTTTNELGATVFNNNPVAIEWLNSTGSDIDIAGFFLTDVISGDSGQVIWVGTPDAGTATIFDGTSATVSENDLILRID